MIIEKKNKHKFSLPIGDTLLSVYPVIRVVADD